MLRKRVDVLDNWEVTPSLNCEIGYVVSSEDARRQAVTHRLPKPGLRPHLSVKLGRDEFSQHPRLALDPVCIILPSFSFDIILTQLHLEDLWEGHREPHRSLDGTFPPEAHNFSCVGMVVFCAAVCVVAAAIGVGVGVGSAASSPAAGFWVVVTVFFVAKLPLQLGDLCLESVGSKL